MTSIKSDIALAHKRKRQREGILDNGVTGAVRTGPIAESDRLLVISAVRQRRYDVLLKFRDEAMYVTNFAAQYQDEFTHVELEERLQFIVDEYCGVQFPSLMLYSWVQSTRWLSTLHERMHVPFPHYNNLDVVNIASSQRAWSSLRYFILRIGAPFDPDSLLVSLNATMVIDDVTITDVDALDCFEMVVKEIASQQLDCHWIQHLTCARTTSIGSDA